jgi:hypothetical protein
MVTAAPDVRAADIAREIGNDGELKRKSKVVAFDDLPGVPEGTPGKIALVGGWDKWIRYHVLFDNGVTLGSVNREHLAPANKYDEYKTLRTRAIESGVLDRPEVDETEAAAAGDGGGEAGGGATVNGVAIPAHLLERSKNARERLGAA